MSKTAQPNYMFSFAFKGVLNSKRFHRVIAGIPGPSEAHRRALNLDSRSHVISCGRRLSTWSARALGSSRDVTTNRYQNPKSTSPRQTSSAPPPRDKPLTTSRDSSHPRRTHRPTLQPTVPCSSVFCNNHPHLESYASRLPAVTSIEYPGKIPSDLAQPPEQTYQARGPLFIPSCHWTLTVPDLRYAARPGTSAVHLLPFYAARALLVKSA